MHRDDAALEVTRLLVRPVEPGDDSPGQGHRHYAPEDRRSAGYDVRSGK
jgi:hypothetical protein